MSIKYSLMEAFGGDHKKKLLQRLEKSQRVTALPQWCSEKYDVEKKGEDENPVFVIKSKKGECKKSLLYIYGGCGILGPSKKQIKFATRLADSTGAAVYFPFYPLAPSNNVRYALRWLQKVYADILKDWSSKKVVFVGDSYGANLAMSLCYRVASNPARLILISPAVGLDSEMGLEKRLAGESTDKVMSVDADKLICANWFKNVHMDSPDADPIRVDCTNFPPVCLFYGTKEIYARSMDLLISKIESGGAALEIHNKKMCHDWVLLQNVSEGKKALKQLTTFMDKDFGTPAPKLNPVEE